MRVRAASLVVALCLATASLHEARAEPKTVCTITVNSANEKEAFRRYLPADRFRFVELVEHGRPDWLASACREGVRCDVLVISGHYDGGHEFFSDKVEAQEFLPVDEMERVACSDSCSGLFSQLKEVYLFGCNTLNPEARKNASAEIVRTLTRSGESRANAERLARTLTERHGESARDRMQLIFKDVPAIYGFSSVAPVGPTAGELLARYFRAGGASEVGSGRSSGKLQSAFTGHSLAVVRGIGETDPRASHRQDVCQFADERLSPAQKLAFVHRLLGRPMVEVRMFLDRLEDYTASLEKRTQTPDVLRARDDIAHDDAARARYLEFARDTEALAPRSRMLNVAARLGWLTPAEKRAETMRMITEAIARNMLTAADVDLVCALNRDGELNSEPSMLRAMAGQTAKVATAAVLACLGSADDQARVLQALTSASDEDVDIAQVYLRHRPIADVAVLRALTAEVALMPNPNGQARAIETLGRLDLSDRQSLEALARLLPSADSPVVQTAIASVLLRANADAIDDPEFVQALRSRRHKSVGGDLIDVLARRLQARSLE